MYLADKIMPEALMEAYMFALALDGSSQATRMLSDIVANLRKHGVRFDESRFKNVKQVLNASADAANHCR